MASNDIEIEIRIPLEGKTFEKIKQKLLKIAKFAKSTQQVDDYFSPCHRNFVAPTFPFEWLRVRKAGNETVLNYKHFYPENAEKKTHCDEFETVIKNTDSLEKIFSALDLKKLVTVEKQRETYNYNNEFEVALDTVKELGHFIEIEAMNGVGGINATIEKLSEFAKELGIDVSKANDGGYAFLLMKKKGLIKKRVTL